MAKTERRRIGTAQETIDGRGREGRARRARQESAGRRRARPAPHAGLHRFLRAVLRTEQRQVKAIADAVEEALRAAKVRPAHVEGYDRAEWVLMDYFTFIVHVFTPQTRDVLLARAAVGRCRAHRRQRRARCGRQARLTAGRYVHRPDDRCDSLLAVLLAPRCAACDAPLDQPTRGAVCRRVLERHRPAYAAVVPALRRSAPTWRVISARDARPARGAGAADRAVSSARAIGAYDGTLRAIVHALKSTGSDGRSQCRSRD